MKLFDHQRAFVLDTLPRAALVWECGTGKSLAVLEVAYRRAYISGETPSVLIICPKALREKWKREVNNIPRFKKYLTDVTVMSKEEFKRDWKTVKEMQFVIVDEAHYFFGTKSQLMRALRSYFNRYDTEYRYLLTATPYRSTPMDVYIMMSLLGHKLIYEKFRDHFFTEVRMGRNTFMKPKDKDDIKDDIADLVSKCGSIVRMDDCFDVPEQLFVAEPLIPNQEQQKAVAELADLIPITRFTAEHQIMGGTWIDDAGTKHVYPSTKAEYIKELVQDNDRLIIVCRYNNEIEMLREMIEAIRPDVYVINGAVPDQERDKITLMTDLKDRYVILVNAKCSEGWEASTCPLMVFYSYDFELKNYVQMQGRIHRANNLKKNVYLSLFVAGTVDEAIYKTIVEDKMDFHAEIYAKE